MGRLPRYRSLTLCAIGGCALFGAACSLSGDEHAERETVVVRNHETPGAFEVENRGPAIDLSPQVVVQRLENGKWEDRAMDLILAESCGSDAPTACIKLARGAKIRPVTWNGLSCSGQCHVGCRGNVYLGPGQFRFAVKTCDGKRNFCGPAFALPDYDHSLLKKKG